MRGLPKSVKQETHRLFSATWLEVREGKLAMTRLGGRAGFQPHEGGSLAGAVASPA